MRIIAIICVSIVFSEVLHAQTEPVLTFREAVKIGLENNVTLNQDKNRLEYTQINKHSSFLQLGPSVQADANASRVNGNYFVSNDGTVVDRVDNLGASVSASTPVFNGFIIFNQYKQAKNLNDAQLYQVNRSSQDVIRDVANQYLTCLLDMQLIKIDEENLAAQRVQYQQIKAQSELGSKAESDLYNQEYQLKNAELLLVRSRNKLKNDKAFLAQTILIDPMTGFELEEMKWNVDALLSDTLSLSTMNDIALQRRSDLKSAEFNEASTHYAFKALKGRYYPSLYAGASLGSAYNYIYGTAAPIPSFDEQFNEKNKRITYGFTLSIPIYNGLLFRAQAANSKALYKNATLTHLSTEIKVKTDVLRASQNFKDATTSYEVSGAQVRAAELAYKTEKEKYDLGMSNIVQLALVNQIYIKAQGDYQNSLFTLMFQRLLINYSLGTLTFEDIP